MDFGFVEKKWWSSLMRATQILTVVGVLGLVVYGAVHVEEIKLLGVACQKCANAGMCYAP